MSDLYRESKFIKDTLAKLIDERINSNEQVKSSIKAKKAIVTTAANTTIENKVGIKLIGDNTELFVPYNSKFSPDELTEGKIVSVWYSQLILNAVVMEDQTWQK